MDLETSANSRIFGKLNTFQFIEWNIKRLGNNKKILEQR